MGCADGFFSIEVAKLGAEVDAIDIWTAAIKRAVWAAEQLGVNVNARFEAAEDISGSCDFVLSLGVLYHTKSPLIAHWENLPQAEPLVPTFWPQEAEFNQYYCDSAWDALGSSPSELPSGRS